MPNQIFMKDKDVNPIVSVIVPTYNRKELLKETIHSILSQTFTDFELIIVDNYSDYDIFSHIESFNDSRIRVVQNRNNGIIAKNRNFGINIAKGKYIAFTDDDDLWLPTKLEKCLYYFSNNKSVDMICTNEYVFSDKTSMKTNLNLLQEIYKDQHLDFKNLFLEGNIISGSTVVIRKECFNEIGLYDESLKYIYTEDYQLWLRMATKFKIYFVSEPLGYSRFHHGNLSADANISLICLYYTLFDFKINNPALFSEIKVPAQKRINSVSISIIKHYLKNGRLLKSIKWSLKLLRSNY
jgi:glycosyltransferase involved in cell wall biosynthesis